MLEPAVKYHRIVDTLGLPRDNWIVVLEGLEPGETVVATGWWRLRDGARVAVVGL